MNHFAIKYGDIAVSMALGLVFQHLRRFLQRRLRRNSNDWKGERRCSLTYKAITHLLTSMQILMSEGLSQENCISIYWMPDLAMYTGDLMFYHKQSIDIIAHHIIDLLVAFFMKDYMLKSSSIGIMTPTKFKYRTSLLFFCDAIAKIAVILLENHPHHYKHSGTFQLLMWCGILAYMYNAHYHLFMPDYFDPTSSFFKLIGLLWLYWGYKYTRKVRRTFNRRDEISEDDA